MLVGCFGKALNQQIDKWQGQNPEGAAIPIDDDGDGTVDAYGADRDGDGRIDRNADDELIEIPGTRFTLESAAQTDTDIGDIITMIGTMAGFPVAGIIGSWWGRRKPLKRFAGVVRSIQRAKQTDSPEGMITLSKEVLTAVQEQVPGMIELITALKAADK